MRLLPMQATLATPKYCEEAIQLAKPDEKTPVCPKKEQPPGLSGITVPMALPVPPRVTSSSISIPAAMTAMNCHRSNPVVTG